MSTGLQERENGARLSLEGTRSAANPPSPPSLQASPSSSSSLGACCTPTPNTKNLISLTQSTHRQGKVRLAKWFTTMSSRNKSAPKPPLPFRSKLTPRSRCRQNRQGCYAARAGAADTDVQLSGVQRCVLAWQGRWSGGADTTRVLDVDSKVIYRRYASLFFVTGVGQHDNELITLEIIHRFVDAFVQVARTLTVPLLATWRCWTGTLATYVHFRIGRNRS